jgi:CheY-like chemotaxis protein
VVAAGAPAPAPLRIFVRPRPDAASVQSPQAERSLRPTPTPSLLLTATDGPGSVRAAIFARGSSASCSPSHRGRHTPSDGTAGATPGTHASAACGGGVAGSTSWRGLRTPSSQGLLLADGSSAVSGSSAVASSAAAARSRWHDLPSPPHVLVVEDDATNRRLMQRLLQRLSVSCVAIEDGDEIEGVLEASGQMPASSSAASSAPSSSPASSSAGAVAPGMVPRCSSSDDGGGGSGGARSRSRSRDGKPLAPRFLCVLCDIHMKRSRGDVMTSVLRARGLSVPVYAMTANTSEADRARYVAAGMESLVVGKPFTADRLLEVLADAVRKQQQQQQAREASPRLP